MLSGPRFAPSVDCRRDVPGAESYAQPLVLQRIMNSRWMWWRHPCRRSPSGWDAAYCLLPRPFVGKRIRWRHCLFCHRSPGKDRLESGVADRIFRSHGCHGFGGCSDRYPAAKPIEETRRSGRQTGYCRPDGSGAAFRDNRWRLDRLQQCHQRARARSGPHRAGSDARAHRIKCARSRSCDSQVLGRLRVTCNWQSHSAWENGGAAWRGRGDSVTPCDAEISAPTAAWRLIRFCHPCLAPIETKWITIALYSGW